EETLTQTLQKDPGPPTSAREKPSRLDIPKVPIAPRMVLAVNVNRDKKWVILEELFVDVSDPAKPKEYTEYLQFSLNQGLVARANTKRRLLMARKWERCSRSPPVLWQLITRCGQPRYLFA